MKSYEDLIRLVLRKGNKRGDRTGTGTTSYFGHHWEHDLREGFPLLTGKRIAWKSCLTELIFFLRGLSDNRWLNTNGCTIWNEWAKEDGDLGPIYGVQWNRPNSEGMSQLDYIEWALRNNPECRRMLCCAWNWGEITQMALPPCHVLFQVYTEDNLLHMQVYQRSCDLFLGVPFNIASYGALLTALADCHGYTPARLRFNFGDLHIYDNHREQVDEYMSRPKYKLPALSCLPEVSVRRLGLTHFRLHRYRYNSAIKAEVSV